MGPLEILRGDPSRADNRERVAGNRGCGLPKNSRGLVAGVDGGHENQAVGGPRPRFRPRPEADLERPEGPGGVVVAVGDTRAGGHRQSPDGLEPLRRANHRSRFLQPMQEVDAGARPQPIVAAVRPPVDELQTREVVQAGLHARRLVVQAPRDGVRVGQQTRKRFENPEQGDDLQSVLVFLGEVGGTGDGIERQRPAPTAVAPGNVAHRGGHMVEHPRHPVPVVGVVLGGMREPHQAGRLQRLQEPEQRPLVLAEAADGEGDGRHRGRMQRVQIGSDADDVVAGGGEQAAVHRLSVHPLRAAPDGRSAPPLGLDGAGQHEERLFRGCAQGELFVALGRARPFGLDPPTHPAYVVGEPMMHEAHDG